MVRHGETAWNAEGRVQGQLDIPLSRVGLAQAHAVAGVLSGQSYAALFCSDLVRVQQTARPLAERLGLAVQLDPRLRERHYGVFQGLTYAEARERLPEDYARFKAKLPDYSFGDGESLRAFSARCIACVGELASRHPGEALLLFTHGGVLEMVYRHATGRGLSTRATSRFRTQGSTTSRSGPKAGASFPGPTSTTFPSLWMTCPTR